MTGEPRDFGISHSNDVRARARDEWHAAAQGWIADREALFEASPVTQRLIDMARISAGHRVLDIACGSGDPAFPIARVVGERGHVLGLDITSAMIDGARELARELGVRNVAFRAIHDELAVRDELAVVEADDFDAVTCRYGLMYMPDPTAAARAWRRVLRPGGRIAVATWASLPLFDFVLGIVARHANVPQRDPAGPGIFALSNTAVLENVVRSAGYIDAEIVRLRTPSFEALPPQEWWDMMARSAGPLVSILASLPEATRSAVRADGIRALCERHPSGIVAEYGDALIATGVNPGRAP